MLSRVTAKNVGDVFLRHCISHSAKHRKMADCDPSGSQNPLTDFDENLAWLTTSGTAPHMTTLVEVAQRGWCDLLHLSVRFFSLSSARAQVAFLDRSARSIRQNAFPAKDVPFGGFHNIRLHTGGQTPIKPRQNGRE